MDKRRTIPTLNALGERIGVVEVVPQIRAPTLDDPKASIDGLPRFHLLDGSAVNMDGDTFVVVHTGERLRRI